MEMILFSENDKSNIRRVSYPPRFRYHGFKA